MNVRTAILSCLLLSIVLSETVPTQEDPSVAATTHETHLNGFVEELPPPEVDNPFIPAQPSAAVLSAVADVPPPPQVKGHTISASSSTTYRFLDLPPPPQESETAEPMDSTSGPGKLFGLSRSLGYLCIFDIDREICERIYAILLCADWITQDPCGLGPLTVCREHQTVGLDKYSWADRDLSELVLKLTRAASMSLRDQVAEISHFFEGYHKMAPDKWGGVQGVSCA